MSAGVQVSDKRQGQIQAHKQLLWTLVGSLCVHLWLQDLGVCMAVEAGDGRHAKAQLEGTALSLCIVVGVSCGSLGCHLTLSLMLSLGLDVSEGSGL